MTLKKRKVRISQLRELWDKYTCFQKCQLAPSTIERDYRKVTRILAKLPNYLDSSVEIRDWLLERYAAETTRRYLMQLSACCKWAIASDFIDRNPFEGLPNQFRRKVNRSAYKGFTTDERNLIIETFRKQDPFYSPWVEFLFWTGCRPEEAAALRWEHIVGSGTQIHFHEAAPVDTKKPQATKTWKNRMFPINNRLRSLLKSLEPERAMGLVFMGMEGKSFEYHNFQTRHWKPLVESLVEEGHIPLYLPQSHCRHTFITLALEHLPVKDVAYLVGNSPEIM